MERRQFLVLFRLFLGKMIDLELLSVDGDPIKLLGQLASLLAAVSFLLCTPLVLASGKIQEADLWTMEHLLIATTMLAAGLFSVLNWDSIFPDRRDVMVLGSLPLAARTIFMAKLAASAAVLSVSVLALNVFTGMLWPLYFPAAGGALAILRSFGAYWITIFAAAVFPFLLVVTVHGLASQVLPRQHFLRLSSFIQVAALCFFLGMYILEPSLEAPGLLNAPENQRLLEWLPSYWFWGLFHQLDGYKGPSQLIFTVLAGRAWIALAAVVPGAVFVLLLSYFRTLRKIVEEPEISPSYQPLTWMPIRGHALARALLSFCLRTLLRSRVHRAILSFYLGIGFALVLSYIRVAYTLDKSSQTAVHSLAEAPPLAASILMLCVGIGGMRIAAAIPVTLQANWIFRITEIHPPRLYLSAVRCAFAVLGVFPIWLAAAVYFLVAWPLRFGMEHLFILALLGMILVEISVWGFQKIPFTCSYLPGSGNLHYLFCAFALLLLPLIDAGAQMELHLLDGLLSYSAIVVVLSLMLAFVRWRTSIAFRSVNAMQFDEVDDPAIFSLNLRRG
jgi:hypothetical protein